MLFGIIVGLLTFWSLFGLVMADAFDKKYNMAERTALQQIFVALLCGPLVCLIGVVHTLWTKLIAPLFNYIFNKLG